jgi:hypothetical protein
LREGELEKEKEKSMGMKEKNKVLKSENLKIKEKLSIENVKLQNIVK